MSINQGPSNVSAPAFDDQPPPYSSVVGSAGPYGFVVPPGAGEPYPDGQPPPKSFTAPGVYPHPPASVTVQMQPQSGAAPPPGLAMPVGLVMAPAVGTEPTTVTCFNCNKVVTTKVTYTTAWHTHLVAGSVCVITM